ncbi:hypothetical protein [Actibacterium pelagium]|uniref:Uncharacterized protein n=1 Tax=Actibacterium pelagium TaxID=2029103 RepID=A0A917EGS1_9RHOB|nr:hypothetical protein [Actibacterium pelagium]GGE37744.1 hypothetical protein GCM10011517_01900 [Actibacterium pelagium]
MKLILAAAAASLALGTAAIAGGHKQAEAQGMKDFLNNVGNQDADTKAFLEGEFGPAPNENAAIPAIVSGGGNGGWGNIGSTLTGEIGTSIAGRESE